MGAAVDIPLWDGPVIDAHQHFWEPAKNPHPWLRPEARIPFRYGDYSAIKCRYLPEDYRADCAGHDVRQTVYVETEWDEHDPLGETRYAHDLARHHGWPNAIVAQAWLDRADVAEVLAGQAAFPLVRSVRHKPGGPGSPAEVGATRTKMSDPVWCAGYALLRRHGLHFDLQTPWWNLPEAEALARDFPETQIILNHAALPGAREDRAGIAAWANAVRAIARCPNVAVKLSGIGEAGIAWTAARNGEIIDTLVDAFGAARCAFGSNFPVDSLCASYDAILTGMKTILARRSRAEQAAIFAGTAARLYRPVTLTGE
ncbi:MAG: amidohydrolase family protein [Rhodospirillales bacterium]|nr:amidohydrolase family protein [Rhodospirillales bacterium]